MHTAKRSTVLECNRHRAMEPTSPSAQSSSSGNDEVLDESEESLHRTRMQRLTHSRAVLGLPRFTQPSDPTFENVKKQSSSHVRCNSQIDPIEVVDVWDVPLSKLRRNSCSCAACGGPKLARKYLQAAIPRAEMQRKDFTVNSIKSLASLIRNYKKDDLMELPGLSTIRMSLILKMANEPSKDLYVKPPKTPRLEKLLHTGKISEKCGKMCKVKGFLDRNEKYLQRFQVTPKAKKGKLGGNAGSQPPSVHITPSTSIDSGGYKDRLSLVVSSHSTPSLRTSKPPPNVKIRPFGSPHQLGRLRL